LDHNQLRPHEYYHLLDGPLAIEFQPGLQDVHILAIQYTSIVTLDHTY
jgi:hypothetical protein